MWALNFLPDIVFYLILAVGLIGMIVGFIFGFIPAVNKYKLPVQIISFLLTVIGVWYSGGIAKDKEFRAQIEAANNRARIAEEKAEAATAQVKYVFLDRVKTVKDVQVVIQERIRDVSVKIDESCRVIPDVIDIHNQAVKNQKGTK